MLVVAALAALAALSLFAGEVASQEVDPSRRRLTLGGPFVDAIAEFHRYGGEVDEVAASDLAYREPQTFGLQHGRSIYALESPDRPGQITGIVTADGGAVKASVTQDGFLHLQPASAGFLARNPDLFRALYPGSHVPGYTEEVDFEYVDESGTRLLIGGAEVTRTTSYLIKKDTETGEIVLRMSRDISAEKAPGGWLDPDVSATFPTKIKLCDSDRSNCVTRLIVKKPGDEIRLDPASRQINITFNKENLPYWKKYGNAQRLSWACEHDGRGFYVTYREGFMGGYDREGMAETGTLTCKAAVLRCERTGPGQKCNFDYRDYLDRPAELALFGLDWILSRSDPHTHYFTVAPDPVSRRHVRIGNLRNLDSIRDVSGGASHALYAGDGPGGGTVESAIRRALCEGSPMGCSGEPEFKVLELSAVGEGLTFIDERSGIKMDNVERARLYSLRKGYGWGGRGDFVAALIVNDRGAAEVMALKRLNAEQEAPDLLSKDREMAPEDNVQAMLKGEEEERNREILRVRLSERSRALVIFPKEELGERPGLYGHTVGSGRTMPATIVNLAQLEGGAGGMGSLEPMRGGSVRTMPYITGPSR